MTVPPFTTSRNTNIIRIYGDYPDEKAHAQVKAFAETEQEQMQFTTETVTTYPAEETNLPYDVVIQKLRVEPENFIDHFYVAVDDSGSPWVRWSSERVQHL